MEKGLAFFTFYSFLTVAFALTYTTLDRHMPETRSEPANTAERFVSDDIHEEAGFRPCKKRHTLKARSNVVVDSDSINRKKLDDQRNLIARLTDQGLEDEANYPEIAAKDSATLKPGSIIKDVVPPGSIILMEAPYMTIRSNLSDQAFQEYGEGIDMELETDQMKTYRGAEAVKRMHSGSLGDTIESFPNNMTSMMNS